MVAAIFFQKESFYTICIIITILLYGYGIFVAVINRKNSKVVDFYKITMLILIINVCFLNILFYGLQRYVVYTFGIYYISLFLQTCALWKQYRKESKHAYFNGGS